MQEVIITGRLGKDPEIKYFDSGKCKTKFTIATDGWNSKKKESFTNWFNVEVWEKQAEFVSEHFKKADTITIFGKYEPREYNGKTYWDVKASYAGYNKSLVVLSGVVTNIEERFTSQNKKIQVISLKDIKYPIYLFNDDVVANGQLVTFLCELCIDNYQPFAKVVKSDLKSNEPPQNQSEQIVKFAEDELIGEDEIPF